MAVPKRRTSKQRKRKRRTHFKAEKVSTQTCPRCGDPKLPHRVCPTCGFYRDEAVIDTDQD
jgi:large subunit ribosomal protein L32